MESDESLAAKEVGGINLDNYFPYQSSFNTVLYVHKRFSEKPQVEVGKGVTEKNRKEDKKKLSKVEKPKSDTKSNINKKQKNHDNVLQQTIKFAKNLVPLVIPPSEQGDTPVYYTIKTCTNCKETGHFEEKCTKFEDMTSEKKKFKKSAATFKKEKKPQKESFSVESTNSSHSNTSEDANNQSLSCSLSELSDKKDKYQKNSTNYKKKIQTNKFRISESLEGLATEMNNVGETNIRIHLMNDREKHHLSESIRMPIVAAVNNCIKEVDKTNIKEDVNSMKRLAMINSQKLDCILERLTCIENYLMNANFRSVRSPKPKVQMPSKLEQLSEDIIDEKEYSSEEEMPKLDSNRQRDEITVLHPVRRERIEELGCGEQGGSRPSTSVGVKTEKHRLPARFCWTDTEMNK